MTWRKSKCPDYYRLYNFNVFFEIISKILRRVLFIYVNIFLSKGIDNIAGGWNWFLWHRSVENSTENEYDNIIKYKVFCRKMEILWN